MRHVYECPMRWADLDLLGHVNNVVYVDYLQEARVDLLRHHGPRAHAQSNPSEGVVVVRHEVTYVEPLTFDFRPVSIEVWVTEVRAASFTLAYEVFRPDGDGRQVHLRASTVLTPFDFATELPRRLSEEERTALEPYREPGEPVRAPRRPAVARDDRGHYPVRVRFSDVDVYGHVNNVKYFEYLQEARLALFTDLWRQVSPDGERQPVLVAQTDVDYRRPIMLRPEPYDAWSVITHVGRTSVTVESEICDGDEVLARARVVLVAVDPATGRPVEPPAAYRDVLSAAVRESPAS